MSNQTGDNKFFDKQFEILQKLRITKVQME